MLRIITHLAGSIIANALILFVISTYISDLWFIVTTDASTNIWVMFTILWAVFWLFNGIIKQTIKILAMPFALVTFWLSSVVINVAIIYVFAYVINTSDIWAQVVLGSIIQTLIVSVVIAIAYFILKKIL